MSARAAEWPSEVVPDGVRHRVDRPIVPVPPLADLGLPEFASFQNGSYAGITFKNTYFVQSSQAQVEALHFHELVHVVQWGYLGVEGFLLTYAAGLISHGYRNSPLEAMAYDLQNYFLSSGKPCDVATDVRASLDRLFPNLMSGRVP